MAMSFEARLEYTPNFRLVCVIWGVLIWYGGGEGTELGECCD